ncbi:MAG: hypothetical protein AUH05_01140 [Ktedonobacter sp. 13_2_20CM_53_11]|nr:MAG: hypothetical protein AUH05_01140 [Ktedonobacter sp. 13_2_20CM_53_11]
MNGFLSSLSEPIITTDSEEEAEMQGGGRNRNEVIPLSFYCRLRRLDGYGFKRLARPGEHGTAEHLLLIGWSRDRPP